MWWCLTVKDWRCERHGFHHAIFRLVEKQNVLMNNKCRAEVIVKLLSQLDWLRGAWGLMKHTSGCVSVSLLPV